MHMLFLPQFTCEFYEEDESDLPDYLNDESTSDEESESNEKDD